MGAAPGPEALADTNHIHMAPGHLTLPSLDDFLPPDCPGIPLSSDFKVSWLSQLQGDERTRRRPLLQTSEETEAEL